MGCLLEMLLEILVTGVLEVTLPIYMKITSLFVPDKECSEKTKTKIKNAVATMSVIELLVMFVGAFFLAPEDPLFNSIGRYMTFIPLAIISVQLLLGIAVTVARAIKKRK